jgi:hypothetical protein
MKSVCDQIPALFHFYWMGIRNKVFLLRFLLPLYIMRKQMENEYYVRFLQKLDVCRIELNCKVCKGN